MPGLEESYFLSVFIGGLRDDIRPMVKMFKPKTLLQAWESAKLQEELVENSKKPKSFLKPYQPNTMSYKTNAYNPGKSSLPNQNFSYPPKPPNSESIQSWKLNLPSMAKNSNTQSPTSANSNSASVNQLPQGKGGHSNHVLGVGRDTSQGTPVRPRPKRLWLCK